MGEVVSLSVRRTLVAARRLPLSRTLSNGRRVEPRRAFAESLLEALRRSGTWTASDFQIKARSKTVLINIGAGAEMRRVLHTIEEAADLGAKVARELVEAEGEVRHG